MTENTAPQETEDVEGHVARDDRVASETGFRAAHAEPGYRLSDPRQGDKAQADEDEDVAGHFKHPA